MPAVTASYRKTTIEKGEVVAAPESHMDAIPMQFRATTRTFWRMVATAASERTEAAAALYSANLAARSAVTAASTAAVAAADDDVIFPIRNIIREQYYINFFFEIIITDFFVIKIPISELLYKIWYL